MESGATLPNDPRRSCAELRGGGGTLDAWGGSETVEIMEMVAMRSGSEDDGLDESDVGALHVVPVLMRKGG